MTDRSSTPPAIERAYAPVVPAQREGEVPSGPRIITDVTQVAELAMQDLVVVGNRTVYGLLGHCNQEGSIQTRIEEVKGEGRKNKPLGLTIPFDHKAVVDIFDTRRDRRLRELMEPDRLTELLGALAFVRAAANENNNLPDCVISKPTGRPEDPDHDKPLAQVYSPHGNRIASTIIGLMTEQGGLPIMSSANKSGKEPSITTTAQALRFAKEHNLPILIDLPDSERDEQPQDSYLVAHIGQSEIYIPRLGWMHEDIVGRVFYGLPRAKQTFVYPNLKGVLRLEHLLKKYPNAEKYRGIDMSHCLREYLEIG